MAGKTFLGALHDKYDAREDENSFITICVPKGAPRSSESGQLIVPTILALNEYDISCCGSGSEIREICCDVTELDLSKNSLQEWEQVFQILASMPNIHFLNLSHNPLGKSKYPPSQELRFDKITKLALNCTKVSWEHVGQILNIMPSLNELHLSLNEFSTMDVSHLNQHAEIQRLYFNNNNITDWNEITNIGSIFPSLEQITLIANPISSFGPVEKVAENLDNLTAINLSEAQFMEWKEVEKLRKLPQLNDIRIKGIPILEAYEEKPRREMCIAYLPNAVRLNGSPVLPEEKDDADRAFIRLYMDEDSKPDRFFELQDVYGQLDKLANVDMDPHTHANVKIHCHGTVQTKCLDLQQTVRELKKAMADIIGLPPSKFRIFHTDIGSPCGPIEFRLPEMNRQLFSIPVKNDDEISLDPK